MPSADTDFVDFAGSTGSRDYEQKSPITAMIAGQGKLDAAKDVRSFDMGVGFLRSLLRVCSFTFAG